MNSVFTNQSVQVVNLFISLFQNYNSMINTSYYINVFANCIPVKGAKSAIICDLQRGNYFEIDMVLHEILENHSEKTIDQIIEFYGREYEDEILNQINQLLKEDLIHITTEPHLFPKLDLTWEVPSVITNMIIEYGDYFEKREMEIVEDLNKLGVKHLELRFYSEVSYESLCRALQTIRKTKVSGIYLVLQDFLGDDIDRFLIENQRIINILLLNVKSSEHERYKDNNKVSVKKNKKVHDHSGGIIRPSAFKVNLELFTESQKFNSYLNRKLTILENGDVKNCPSMPEVLGNIQQSRLVQIFDSKKDDLIKDWSISIDEIKICKDCEFRYICPDTRAFNKSDNVYSKSLNCHYNPYIGEWEDRVMSVKALTSE